METGEVIDAIATGNPEKVKALIENRRNEIYHALTLIDDLEMDIENWEYDIERAEEWLSNHRG